jgi:GGDEF domain-containing protein
MSHPASRVWTEFRPRFALVVAALLAAGVLLGVDEGSSRAVFAVILVVAVGASLIRDGYAGVLIGLGGAGLLVLGRRLTGELTTRSFFLVAAEVVAVTTVAWLVGILGHHLRGSVERATRATAGSVRPVDHRMGVLGPEIGLHRLDEELARRSSAGGALGVALVRHDATSAYGADVPEPARRAIARHIESVLGDTDVVFGLDDDTLVVILPSADWTAGLDAVSRLAVAASQATYADPLDRSRRAVTDMVHISTALVYADDTTRDARALLDVAREQLSLDDGRRT